MDGGGCLRKSSQIYSACRLNHYVSEDEDDEDDEFDTETESSMEERSNKGNIKWTNSLRITSKPSFSPKDELRNYQLHLNTSQLSIFCVGNETVLSIHDNPGVHHSHRKSNSQTAAENVIEPWVFKLGRRLGIRNSKLRHNDAYFLLYALLDSCVDQYFPVVETFSHRILLMERQLANNPREEFDINGVNKIKRQLEMLHRLLRPVKEVVRHCIDEMDGMDKTEKRKHGSSAIVYVLDDCITSIEACRSICDQSAQLRDMKMNEVMYFLTLVTTLFVPAEFLTGVYGMNFDVIPELKWRHGYYAFWCFFAVSVFFTLLYFRRRGWV